MKLLWVVLSFMTFHNFTLISFGMSVFDQLGFNLVISKNHHFFVNYSALYIDDECYPESKYKDYYELSQGVVMGQVEERTISRVGGSSLMVTLPLGWCRFNGLRPGDKVLVTTNGELRVRPKLKSRRRSK